MSQSILHTVNQSPFASPVLENCLRIYRPGDALLLLEDGVYGALQNQPLATAVSELNCYVLQQDLNARGLSELPLIEKIKQIGYKGFVQLSIEHASVQSWY